MRKQLVRWTEDELRAVVHAAVDLRIMQPEPSLLTIVCLAQSQVLPEGRRRALTTIGAVPEVAAGVREGLLESCTSTSPLVEVEVPRVEYRQEPGEIAVRRLTTSELLVEMARRLAPLLDGQFAARAVVEQPVAQRPVAEAPVPEVERPRLPVVAVIGLLPAQQHEVRAKAKGLTNIEVVFVAKSSKPRIPTRVQYCVVQKHSGHIWYDAAQAKVGGKNTFFEPGGETGVLRRLADINSRIH